MRMAVLIATALLLVSAAACGTTTQGMSEYTADEQEIITFCSQHIDDLDGVLADIEAVLDDSDDLETLGELAIELNPIFEDWEEVGDAYSKTTDGYLVGGEVEELERLWKKSFKNLGKVLIELGKLAIDPADADAEAAGVALAYASMALDDMRVELEQLQ